ncbi:hypothetical protein LJR039_005354 [Pseudorhodoferax sp. LjRoot39]|uniref:hypothetical protein n=1 Tax=Pseudorhodoferax sp. LjRoot39 TaxID=3342328 RepID=UPI003ECC2A5A
MHQPPIRRRALLAMAGLAGASALPALAGPADGWPNKPVKVIVSLPPGSGADTIARFLAPRLQQRSRRWRWRPAFRWCSWCRPPRRCAAWPT